jgi:DNA-binding SARP family transcriptional activator
MLRIGLLGGLQVEADGQEIDPPESRRARTLLAWLALHPGRHGRSKLAGVLRPDAEEDDARRSLRQATWLLGKALGDAADGALVATRSEVGLFAGAIAVDVAHLRAKAAEGDLEAARALRSGTLLPEHDEEWAIEAREELRAELGDLLARRAATCEAADDLDGAVRWARERAAADPLSETAQTELMRLLTDSGDRAAAVQVADALRRRLSDELGVTPSAETRAAIDDVLDDERPSQPRQRQPAAGRQPPAPASGQPPAEPSLPAPLATAAGEPMANSEREMNRLLAAYNTATTATPTLTLVAGEAGSGKTRLVAEAAARIAADGGAVLYGRCDEEPLASYQPFTDALERAAEDGVLPVAALPEVHAGELARMLPRVAASYGAPPPQPDSDPELARYRMFEAVRATLAALTADRPALLVLDDVQWADAGGLALLGHLAGRLRDERLLVLMAFRDADPGAAAPHALARLLTQLRRSRPVDRIELEPLSADAIADLLPAGAAPGLAQRVQRRTGGNALFVVETLRDLDSSSDPAQSIPLAVQELIEQRVERLGDDALAVVRAAAVSGMEFGLPELAALCDIDEDAVVAGIDTALEARLIREEAGAPGVYQFTHGLVADAVYGGMSGARRARLHCRLGHALAERGAPAGAIAHHMLAGAPAGDADLTLSWAERAAAAALGALAYDEAATIIRRALALTESQERRASLLATLGDALDRAGRRDEARAAFADAAEAACAIGDKRTLAVAALGYKGLAITVTTPDPTAVGLLERALKCVGDDDPALRGRLLAALALEAYYADPDRARRRAAEAVQLARGARDPATLAHTLSAQHLALWDGDHAHDRLGVAGEMARVARAAKDRVALLQARNWRFIDLLELGKVGDAREEMEAYAREAADLRLARFEWYVPLWGACFAMLEGDWDKAEELSRDAHEQGVAAGDGNAELGRLIQRSWALFEQERWDELDLERLEQVSLASPTGRGAWVGWLATAYHGLGDLERAQERYDELAADDFALMTNDINWHMVCDAAESTALLGTSEQAASLRKRIARFERLAPVMGRGIACVGPFAYYLGRLAVREGDMAEAARLYEWAVDAAERMGARPRAELAQRRLDEVRAAA